MNQPESTNINVSNSLLRDYKQGKQQFALNYIKKRNQVAVNRRHRQEEADYSHDDEVVAVPHSIHNQSKDSNHISVVHYNNDRTYDKSTMKMFDPSHNSPLKSNTVHHKYPQRQLHNVLCDGTSRTNEHMELQQQPGQDDDAHTAIDEDQSNQSNNDLDDEEEPQKINFYQHNSGGIANSVQYMPDAQTMAREESRGAHVHSRQSIKVYSSGAGAPVKQSAQTLDYASVPIGGAGHMKDEMTEDDFMVMQSHQTLPPKAGRPISTFDKYATRDPQFITTSWQRPPTSKSRQFNHADDDSADEVNVTNNGERQYESWKQQGRKPSQVSFKKQRMLQEEQLSQQQPDGSQVTHEHLLAAHNHPRSVTYSSIDHQTRAGAREGKTYNHKTLLNRPNSAALLKGSYDGAKVASTTQNSQQRVKKIKMGTAGSLVGLNSHVRQSSATQSHTLLNRQHQKQSKVMRELTPSQSPLMPSTYGNDLYASTSDEMESGITYEEPIRDTTSRRRTPFKRSPSVKSARSNRSKKSTKSQRIARTLHSRSRSRSSHGSRHTHKLRKPSTNAYSRAQTTTLAANAANYTTMSLPQLKPIKEKSVRNIILKGGVFTTKSASKTTGKKSTTKKSGKDKTGQSLKEKDLMEKLLTQITAKYKSSLIKNPNYLQGLEKNGMIQEIQMLAQALISCDRAQKKQYENNQNQIKRLQAELASSEAQVKSSLKCQLKLEKEYERASSDVQKLFNQIENQKVQALSQEEHFTATQAANEQEKQEIEEQLEREKQDCLATENQKFQQRLQQFKQINHELGQKAIAAKKTEEQLHLTSEELVQVKEDFFKAHQNADIVAKECQLLEQKVESLQEQVRLSKNQVIDNIESERNKTESNVIQLQMTMKVKDEQILSLRHEVKILENRLKTKLTEMSEQKHSISVTYEEGKKHVESQKTELELKDLQMKKLERQLADKEEEVETSEGRSQQKLTKQKERYEAMLAKLNSVVDEQLGNIQGLKKTNQDLDSKVSEMEKEALLRDNGCPPNMSTLNTSKGDIGNMSLRDLRKEDNAAIEDLNEQIRTKEEEIQILWNVMKEINKLKGGIINVNQLQKLVTRSESLVMQQTSVQSEAMQSMYATPGHANCTKRY